ncbi:MAG TPA: winged helix-turn-helix domain-containing protein, partial [Bryobacteraceae bacterium]|nr:winged helix-turn-helix domain-containing protein [Bryobacteraceae bacterium]
MKQRVVFAFGPWRLDPVAKVLFRDGEPVHMTRKAVETLLVLVENPGRVLTKEEIMRGVWPDRIVDEANLAQNIAVVRRILAAEKGTPAHIETFPGRGYRLEGPVVTESDHPVTREDARPADPASEPVPRLPPAPPPSSRSQWRRWTVGLLLVFAGVGFAVYRNTSSPDGPSDGAAVARVTPVTRLAGKEYQTAISPDGSRIAFLWAEDGTNPPQVWVQDSTGQNGRPLSRGGHHSSPAWSPDGARLAFLRIQRSGTEVVVASLDGTPERVLARFPQSAYGYDHRMLDWSPDGRNLAISRPIEDNSTLALHLIDAASGAERQLTDPGRAAGDVDPRFSPDGSRVSFLRLILRTQQEIFTTPA